VLGSSPRSKTYADTFFSSAATPSQSGGSINAPPRIPDTPSMFARHALEMTVAEYRTVRLLRVRTSP